MENLHLRWELVSRGYVEVGPADPEHEADKVEELIEAVGLISAIADLSDSKFKQAPWTQGLDVQGNSGV